MGALKKYFKREFQMVMLNLEHTNVSDFYISSFQKSFTPVPLLCIRTLVFVSCLGILLASTIMTGNAMSFAFWPIFMTHWGLVFITATSAFATYVSLMALLDGPIDAPYTLPWYVKTYWILYSMTVPIAFFISAFYWSLLTQTEDEFSINPVLDVFIHAVNSILMLVLLLFSRHPARLVHVVYPLGATIVYLAFTIIYYYVGGTNPFGEVYIYPMLDWSNPVRAALTVVLSAVILVFMHVLVVAISVGRDVLTKRYGTDNHSLNISNDAYN